MTTSLCGVWSGRNRLFRLKVITHLLNEMHASYIALATKEAFKSSKDFDDTLKRSGVPVLCSVIRLKTFTQRCDFLFESFVEAIFYALKT